MTLAFGRVGWHHPEWPAATLAACAWIALVASHDGSGGTHIHDVAHHGSGQAGISWTGGIAGWMLMSTAMMVPAALPAVRRVALGALWHRRQRVAGLFLASYLGVWAAFGAVALSSAAVVQHVVQADTETLTSGVLIAAAAWELTRWKRRSLRGCHVIPPLPPRGWKADAACMRAGLRYGQQCVVGCWALMLTMAITGHASPALTPFLAVLIASQRLLVRGTQIGPLASLALVSTAVFLVTA